MKTRRARARYNEGLTSELALRVTATLVAEHNSAGDLLAVAAVSRMFQKASEHTARRRVESLAARAGAALALDAPWRAQLSAWARCAIWLRHDRGVECSAGGRVERWQDALGRGRSAVRVDGVGARLGPRGVSFGHITHAGGSHLVLALPAPTPRAGLIACVASAAGDCTLLDLFSAGQDAHDGRPHCELCHGYPATDDADAVNPRVCLLAVQHAQPTNTSPSLARGQARGTGAARIYCLHFAPAPDDATLLQVQLFVDGHLEVSQRFHPSALEGHTDVMLGSASDGSFPLRGALLEVALWAGAVPSGLRRAVENALATKHNLVLGR